MGAAARTAILAIGAAIEALADPETLNLIVRAAAAIHDRDARVIITGMGKCSHVGRKIAATLQSTGQPSAFLHPGEAAHGDMGMIARGDILLALSNSGETDEVIGVARYAIARSSLLITITSKLESPLAQMAEHVLPVPALPEGCPIGRAPMASAAAMMALGDALAAELMAARGFTQEQFLELHHGGYLGRQIRAVA